MKKIYALYKGETLIADGTKQEIAEQMGVKLRTINFYMTPTYKKRGKGDKGNRRRIVYLCTE